MLNRTAALTSLALLTQQAAAQLGFNTGDWDSQEDMPMMRKWIDSINGWGYGDFEAHKVITDDGFHLTLMRLMPRTREAAYGVGSPKNPILFVPPMTGVAHEWINGYHYDRVDGQDPMFMQLLEGGEHDVWFMYTRGKKYCHKHEWLQPWEKEYWDFSFEENGTYDLAAVTKFIYEQSGGQKVGMIGYS